MQNKILRFYMLSFENFYNQISKTILKDKKYKFIKQFLEILYKQDSHLSIEQIEKLYLEKNGKNISKTSIYNAINLLEKHSIINCLKEDKIKKFELNIIGHHDHIRCINCNKIIEFTDNELEILQEKICKENNFILINHKVDLIGFCNNCINILSKKADNNTQKTLSKD